MFSHCFYFLNKTCNTSQPTSRILYIYLGTVKCTRYIYTGGLYLYIARLFPLTTCMQHINLKDTRTRSYTLTLSIYNIVQLYTSSCRNCQCSMVNPITHDTPQDKYNVYTVSIVCVYPQVFQEEIHNNMKVLCHCHFRLSMYYLLEN